MKLVNNSKIYRCTHYKTDYKCKFFIILNDKNKNIKYYNNHNHLEEDYNATMSLLKHKINKSIKDKTSLGMKPKLLYNKYFQKIGKYCPNYNSVRTQMMRTINKQYLSNIKTEDIFVDGSFSTAPKFKVNKNACKYKNNVIISPIKFHCDFEKGISNTAKKIIS
ncbi:hypothetical protein PIROE2DRAFT_17042 [Piromyces sp. E2]|nr:hypothetical protein PIROE2DRAFT_17042 [Piromyces sp. E2]|eukprot:OUM57848.1 hypothetical protein PIROE2DRAFT_17042 [Piromyces sp. E2]